MLGKVEGKRSGWQRMKWFDSITDSNGHKYEQTWGDSVHCNPWGHKEADMI